MTLTTDQYPPSPGGGASLNATGAIRELSQLSISGLQPSRPKTWGLDPHLSAPDGFCYFSSLQFSMSVPFSEPTLPLPVSQAWTLLSSPVLPVGLGGKPHSEQLTRDGGGTREAVGGFLQRLGALSHFPSPPTQLETVRFHHS